VQEHAALEVTARRAQRLALLRHTDGMPLDALELARGHHQRLARERDPLVEPDRVALRPEHLFAAAQ